MRRLKLRNELINSQLSKRCVAYERNCNYVKRPEFEAVFLKENDARELMPLLLAVNNFNLVISYVLWVLIYIFSQKKTQLIHFHLSYKETYKQLAPVLQTHSRHFGGFVTKK